MGAGPGDPGLLTLKGKRCLEEADLILYDGLVNPMLLLYSSATAERTGRTDAQGKRTLDQSEINQRLVEAGLAGKTVIRLKGGDPFIFGRGSEEAKALAEAGVPYEVVPGITAATAAAEYAGISLTHREHASAVAFVTGHEDPEKSESALDYDQLARFPGTLVFYMGLHRLPKIATALVECGKSPVTPVAVISKGSTPVQKTVTGRLDDIDSLVKQAGLKPPSLIIVGHCVSMRQEINWFESLPLAGVKIGITRPPHQTDEVIDLAHRLGAQPILMPTMEIRPVSDWSQVDQEIQQLQNYDWLVFTSVNGVECFLNRIWETGGDSRSLSNCRIACIGPATAERLAKYNLRADVMPEVYRGEALADELKEMVKGQRVLWPRANRGRDVLPEVLTAAGAEFKSLIVYEHRDITDFDERALLSLKAGEVDWIGLSSPSIARQVATMLSGMDVKFSPRFAAISPVTEAAAVEAGLAVQAVASEHTWAGLFAAIQICHPTAE